MRPRAVEICVFEAASNVQKAIPFPRDRTPDLSFRQGSR
jgi:hypothetical protein